MQVSARDPRDVGTLAELVRSEKNSKQRDRYRAVLLALEGQETLDIAETIDRSRSFVQTWVYRYRDGGLDNLKDKPRRGRQPFLTDAQRHALRQRLDAGPTKSDGVCALRGKEVRRILKKQMGVSMSLGGAYALLHRLGYSLLRPRPRHRKNDPEAAGQFKRRAPLL